jgi:hypothetical protein
MEGGGALTRSGGSGGLGGQLCRRRGGVGVDHHGREAAGAARLPFSSRIEVVLDWGRKLPVETQP